MLLLGSVNAAAPNPWFSSQYLSDGRDDILNALQQHVEITVISVLAGLVVSIPLALLARRSALLETFILGATGVIYTIPSLALFAALVPFTHYTALTAEIALALYTLVILVRNNVVGLASVPPDVREAADGMGIGPARRLLRVDLPLALPAVIAGVRIATVSTISLLTIAAFVGTGGLGALIDDGFRNNFYRAEILTGVVLCVALAIVADVLLLLLQRVLLPWQRGRAS